MTAHEICEPEDQTSVVREVFAYAFKSDALPRGWTFDRLRRVAAYASSRPGRLTKNTLALGDYPDWADAINALEEKLRPKSAREQEFVLIDGRVADAGSGQQNAPLSDHVRSDLMAQKRQVTEAGSAKEWSRRVRGGR